MFNLGNRVIDAGRGGNLSKYINHSCDPNCIIKINDNKILIYSKKTIKKGEELTFDYRFNKNSFKEICNCGSKNCRGHINEA